jgi:hypothetical protein
VRTILFVTVVAIVLWPVVGSAQVSGAIDTSAGGSVGGPINTQAGGSVDGRVGAGGLKNEPPRDVLNYVRGLGTRGGGTGSGVSVGDTVTGAAVRAVPGNDNWGYAVVNGERVIINKQIDTVTDIVR